MITALKKNYSDFFLYLKSPIEYESSDHSIKEKLGQLFSILSLDLIAAGIGILLLSMLEEFGIISIDGHKVIELMKSMSTAGIIIGLIIVVPFIEELIFRSYLRYNTNLFLHLFLSFFYLFGKKNHARVEKKMKEFWKSKYAFTFYFSAVLFGFVHIFNFDLDLNKLLLFPIITLPQVMVGLFAGYLRVKYNLVWGFFLHATHNFLLFIPYLLGYTQ